MTSKQARNLGATQDKIDLVATQIVHDIFAHYTRSRVDHIDRVKLYLERLLKEVNQK